MSIIYYWFILIIIHHHLAFGDILCHDHYVFIWGLFMLQSEMQLHIAQVHGVAYIGDVHSRFSKCVLWPSNSDRNEREREREGDRKQRCQWWSETCAACKSTTRPLITTKMGAQRREQTTAPSVGTLSAEDARLKTHHSLGYGTQDTEDSSLLIA